ADVDNDGLPEIGLAVGSAYYVLETDGSIKWQVQLEEDSGITGSTVFDFDGDGSAEIAFRDNKHLFVFDGAKGDVLFKTPMSSITSYEYPVVADVDNDGNAEIITVADSFWAQTHNGIYVIGDLNDTWVSTRKIWNQHSYHITNVNDDGTIPRQEANSWQVYN
ncbi:MAG: FG-GAP repeat domain-containing protein, partial [bacterium]